MGGWHDFFSAVAAPICVHMSKGDTCQIVICGVWSLDIWCIAPGHVDNSTAEASHRTAGAGRLTRVATAGFQQFTNSLHGWQAAGDHDLNGCESGKQLISVR